MYQDLNDFYGVAHALYTLGILAQVKGDIAEAASYFRESLAIRRALDVPLDIAESLAVLSFALSLLGQLDESGRLAQECIALCRRLNLPGFLAEGLNAQVVNLDRSRKIRGSA